MRRLLSIAVACMVSAAPAYAQLGSDFDNWVLARPAATFPLGTSDAQPVVQGGQTRHLFPQTAFVPAASLGVSLAAYSPDTTGAVDSQPQWVLAQNAAVANGSLTVAVGAGTYSFARRLNLSSGMRFICLAPGSCILKPVPVGSVQSSMIWYADTGINDVLFDGFKWDGNAASVGRTGVLGLAFQASRIVIKNAEMTNNRQQFFNFTQCNYCGVTDSHASNVNKFHLLAASNSALVTNAPTAAGNPILHFASVPNELQVGDYAYDVTTPGALPFDVTAYEVTAISGGDVTLNGNATGGGVLSGDTIQFLGYGSKLATWSTGTNGFWTNNRVEDDGTTPINVVGMTNFQYTGNRATASTTESWINPFSGGGTACAYFFGAQNSGVVIDDNVCSWYTGNVLDVSSVQNFAIGAGNVMTYGGLAGLSLSADVAGSVVSDGTVAGTYMNNGQAKAGLVSMSSNAVAAAGQRVILTASTTGVAVGMYLRDTGLDCTFPNTKVASFVANTSVTVDKDLPVACANPTTFQLSPRWPVQPALTDGLYVGCNPFAGACTLTNINFGQIRAGDNQVSPTQQWGIHFSPSVTMTNARFGNLALIGNVLGGQSDYPGSFSLTTQDGTVTGGNPLGAGAVDLQRSIRTAATQVASGINAFAAGQTSQASGTSSYSLGSANSCQATYSGCLGRTALSTVNGLIAFSSGRHAINGDAQGFLWQGSATGTGAGTYQLTSGAAAAAANTIPALLNNSAKTITCNMIVHDSTPSTASAAFTITTSLLRAGTVASTAMLTGAPTAWTAVGSEGAASDITATAFAADTTNGGPKIQFTVGAGTLPWHATATCTGAAGQ